MSKIKLKSNTIEMKKVESLSIVEMGIDELRFQLKIKFCSGSEYLYSEVPLSVLKEIQEDTIKTYYRKILGVYPYVRLKKAPSKWIDPYEKKLKGVK